MREIEKEYGRVYEKDGFYYLEKIYDDLYDLILDVSPSLIMLSIA